MLFPLVVGLVAVALGALLALGPPGGAKSIAAIRIVSAVAAVGVVALHLLPEAVRALGAWSVVAFVAGVLAPRAIEWVVERATGNVVSHSQHEAPTTGAVRHGAAALDVSYAGLVVHRFGDGLSMGAYSRLPNPTATAALVLLAFAAHIVPVTTIMVLAASGAKGRSAAVYYAAGLAVAIAAGVVAATLVLAELPQGLEAWTAAVVAGLLIHVVFHTGFSTSMFGFKKE
jgi:zinc transporter ZupT